MDWLILLIIFITFTIYYLYTKSLNQVQIQTGGGSSDCYTTKVSSLSDVKVCTRSKAKRQDYYPRYKFWWSHVKDLPTRPPYDRIFPPFWNTDYDPNITSDEYYKRLQADGIVYD